MERDILKIKELEKKIGARSESTTVDSSNRTQVKAWLRALGIASKKTETMKMVTLRKCYQLPAYLNAVLRSNDLPSYNSDSEEIFDAEDFTDVEELLSEDVFEAESTTEDDEAKTIKFKQAFRDAKNKEENVTAQTQNPEVLAQLATLLGSLAPQAPAIDEALIRKIAAEEAAKSGFVKEIIVKLPNKKETKIDGAQHHLFEDIVKILGLGENVFLVGPAGSGKTTTCMNAAKALGRDFYFTGSVASEHKLIGWMDANSNTVRTPFREAFEKGGVFLFDEVDASNPAALLALNAALDNGICAFPDETVEAHPDFIAICAANTWGNGANAEYCGRNRLDGASLQRFIQIEFDYDEKLERAIAGNDGWVAIVQGFRQAKDELGVKAIISPRQSIKGAKLLAAGYSEKRTKELLLGCGLDESTKNKIWQKASDLIRAKLRNAA